MSQLIYVWFRRRLHADLALELTAETFAEAVLSLKRFRDLSEGSALPWLYGIARNLLLRYLERQRVETRARKRLGMSVPERDDAYDTVDERLRSDQLRDLLDDALAALPKGQRQAVELRIIEEMSYAEVGRALGCTSLAARLRVHRGLAALGQALDRPAMPDHKAAAYACETPIPDPGLNN